MTKILLHSCCAPCTTYVNKWLTENDFEVKALFYNPNIRPQEEYERRLLTMEHYATVVSLKVIYDNSSRVGRPLRPTDATATLRGLPTRDEEVKENDLEIEPGKCENCYQVRLQKTAKLAKQLGFEYFTTTLLVSPYQKHDLLKQVGERVGLEFGVNFFYQDFRVGYRESIRMSKEMKLYRQKYCGCGIELNAKVN